MVNKLIYSIHLYLLLILGLSLFSPRLVNAQAAWEMCSDGTLIVRCESINCPRGDTSGDGTCTLSDEDSSFTDFRNDALCANPVSGCGVVRYYNQSNNCNTRVKQDAPNCTLYATANPNFTPPPTQSGAGGQATLAPVQTPTSSPNPIGGTVAAKCVNLVAEPTSSNKVPADVKFTALADGQVTGYEFNFGDDATGDNDVFRLNTNTIIHRYEKSGKYVALVRVAQGEGLYETKASCSATVTIDDGQVLTKGGEPVEKLPETGSEIYGLIALIAMGFGGIYMYERFRVA